MKKIGIIAFLCIAYSMSIFASEDAIVRVDTFDTTPVTISECEGVPGSGIATFNLSEVEDDIVVILPNMLVNWYVDASLSIMISDLSAYEASSSVVFAQVISTLDTVCKSTEEVTLAVLSTPDLSYLESIPDTFCGRPIVQLGATDGPEVIYVWEPADNLSSDTVANPIFTPDDDKDEYSYSVTATSLDGMCQTSTTVEFVVLSAEFEIDAPDTVELCQGDANLPIGAITSGNPDDIVWSSSRDTLTSMTGLTTSIDAEYSTFVYAVQTFENGCVLRDTVFVRVDSLPNFDISVIPDVMEPCQKYCPGTTVTLVTNAVDLACYPDIEYLWTPPKSTGGDIVGADTTLNVALSLSNANTRLYTRTTTNHACVEVDTHTVRVVDTIIDINGLPSMDRICRGDTFTLMIDDSDWVNLTEVMWSVEREDIFISCEDCQSPLITVDPNAMAGPVMITVTGVAEECCTASGAVFFNVAIPIVPADIPDICIGGSGQIIGNVTFTNYDWNITLGSGSLEPTDVSNPTVSNIGVGGMTVFVSALAPDGCPSESTYTISSFKAAAPQVAAPATCDGGNSRISNNSPGQYTDYVWTLTSGTGEIDDPNSATPTVLNVGLGGATIRMTATDLNGCLTDTTLLILIDQLPALIIPTVQGCIGGSAQLQIVDAGLTNIQWETPNAQNGTIDDPNSATPTISNLGALNFTVNVTATDDGGCMRQGFAFVEVFMARGPSITAPAVCPEGSVTFALDDGFMNYTFSSDSSQVEFSVEGNDLTISEAAEGNFTVIFNAIREDGCVTVDSFDVGVLPLDQCDALVPNAFMPAGTVDENKRFQPLDSGRNPLNVERILDFVVYNRWGQKVYDNDSNATGWDGRQNGELAPSDVYLYIIKVRNADGSEDTFTGDVSLIR